MKIHKKEPSGNINKWYPDSKPRDGVFIVKTSLNSYSSRNELLSNYGKQKHFSRSNEDSPFRKVFNGVNEYLRNSTLHGLKYVGDNCISYGERLFWLLSFAGAVVGAVYFISNIYYRYNVNPVIVSINPSPTPVEEIPFPAVTICNMNSARRAQAEMILANGTDTDKSLLEDICDFTDGSDSSAALNNHTGNWINVLKFMSSVSQPCNKMMKVCKWLLKDVNCNKIFNPIATDAGLCCTFNMLPLDYILRNPGHSTFEPDSNSENYATYQIDDWNPERGYSPLASPDVFPFRNPGPGSPLGLTLVLDANLDDYFCSISSSTGFKILLHNPAEIPKMADFAFMLPPGYEIGIVFKPTINEAVHSLKTLSINKRKCYFSDEKYLKFYRTYTKVNCKMECLANVTLQRCGCVSYYLPKDASTKICGKMQEACSDTVREMMDLKQMSLNEQKTCDCLPSCFQLDYEKSMSYGRLADTFKVRADIIKNETDKYFKKNMMVVQIYFVSTQFSKFTKSELYGFSEFLSNTGGILGLFLGFSILSVVEILYYLTLRLLCSTIRWKRNNRQQHKIRLVR